MQPIDARVFVQDVAGTFLASWCGGYVPHYGEAIELPSGPVRVLRVLYKYAPAGFDAVATLRAIVTVEVIR